MDPELERIVNERSFEKLLARAGGGDDDALDEARALLDKFSREQIVEYERILVARLDETMVKRAAVNAHLGGAYLAAGQPVPVDFHAEAAKVRKGSGPSGDRILAGLLLLEHARDIVPYDERTVSKSLDPLHRPDFNDYRAVYSRAVALLRTAAYYILDARDTYDALASEPPVQETFPPLPFQRVWIEAHLPGQTKATPYLRFSHPDGADHLEVLGVGIVEVERSRTWDLYIAFRPDREVGQDSFFFAARITPEAPVLINSEGEVATRCFEVIRALAVGGAHLITAKNVPHADFPLPRAQRKRLRDVIPAMPKLYYVDLSASGERDFRETGRTYHVRWLVRGHWRHMDGGQTLCTCCAPARVATWIEPYIKGPVGAPWKGRPVHRVGHQGAEAA